ncbi:AI-2E family transporter [Faecalicatena contorta]|uniref:AI-2E family transporter n=1 Tax=Faecalicatena contorta TaxID=39482 RepID=UPI001F389A3F|nr:AI-2E family transporter [Faecalicatena contorta]MCF2555116.1 AI-2E family transporter [Faecalicatena contorta]
MNQDNKNSDKKAYYEERPEFGKKGPSKLRQHFNRGITSFLVVAASILFYFALLRLGDLSDVFTKVTDVLRPIMYGCIIAYLLNPIVKRTDKILVPVLSKSIKSPEKAKKAARGAGILASIIILLMVIAALFNLLIPELYSSIRNLVFTLPRQITEVLDNMNDIKIDDSPTGALIKTAIREGSDMFMNWLRTDLLDMTNQIMANLTEGVITFVNEVFNILIGLIVSIYILFSKELFGQQSKKMVYAFLNTDHANMFLHIVTKSNEIFGGFIIGKIIDSIIIGIICFFGLTILKMPYVMLVSVIVGVTNVIPFFGPYIGAIPSAILIMLTDPMKGVYFILFILLLQQFDGNILGPKILGNSTGLSAFWVIVAILLGGGLFGFVGMVMGVPTFAVIYYIAQMIVHHQLEKKKLPVDTECYDEFSYVDATGKYVHSEERTEMKGE